jgi:hypothetical protein
MNHRCPNSDRPNDESVYEYDTRNSATGAEGVTNVDKLGKVSWCQLAFG